MKDFEESYRRRVGSVNNNEERRGLEQQSRLSQWKKMDESFVGLHHQQILQERARRFIAKIRKYKQENDGYFLWRKQKTQEKKLKLQKQLTEARTKEKLLNKWQKRAKILQKIYANQLKKEEKFARDTLENVGNMRKEKTHQKEQNKHLPSLFVIKEKGIPKGQKFAKRFKTIGDESSPPSHDPYDQLLAYDVSENKNKKSKTLSISKGMMKNKKQKMLYLSNDDRLKIEEISQKIKELNKVTRLRASTE